MKFSLGKNDLDSPTTQLIERISGEELSRCYQCGNCSGSCPVSFAMDIAPAQIIRLLQFGQVDEVMNANSMWMCVGCLQCYSRCPQGVSLARLLEALRQMTLRSGEDHEELSEIPALVMQDGPQQALVCGMRKFSS